MSDSLSPSSPSPAPRPRDNDPHVVPARYLTASVPGLGGRLRQRPEDFLVEEQPLYQPGGEGEHIYVLVEKRNLSTLMAARVLARHFGVHPSAVGHAGLKDKVAITRQVFSIHTPGKRPEDFPMLTHERMGILWTDLHSNKLRTGHLAGNRFSIRIRGVEMTRALQAGAALRILEREGVPNRIGEQRFGYTLRNHLVGRALILGDHAGVLAALLGPAEGMPDGQIEARRLYAAGRYEEALHAFLPQSRTERRVLGVLMRGGSAAKAIHAIERTEEEFFLAAFQSAVFNAVLDRRLVEGTLGTLVEGDLAFKHDNRAVFAVETATLGDELTGRLSRFEISPSGPMWGPGMMRASGAVDQAEVAALTALGVTVEDLDRFGERRSKRLVGTRRPLRVRLTDPDVEGGVDEHGSYVRVAFDLPRGAFATTVLREIMKPELAGSAGALGEASYGEGDETMT
jgi:tRNA pseudouridine13 synthase